MDEAVEVPQSCNNEPFYFIWFFVFRPFMFSIVFVFVFVFIVRKSCSGFADVFVSEFSKESMLMMMMWVGESLEKTKYKARRKVRLLVCE